MKQIPMTVRGAELLRQELDFLKNERRPEIIKAIAEAREHGDLKENAEYEIFIDGSNMGKMKTNLGGKLSLSVELDVVSQVAVKVEKC